MDEQYEAELSGRRHYAFFRAGRHVATCLRSGMDWQQCDPWGCHDLRAAPSAAIPFVAYSGPWARARDAWRRAGCVSADRAGRVFDDYVAFALDAHPEDAMAVAMAEYEVAQVLRDGGADDEECWRWLRGVKFAWRGELEDMWPVIDHVGACLLHRDVPMSEISRLVDERRSLLYC